MLAISDASQLSTEPPNESFSRGGASPRLSQFFSSFETAQTFSQLCTNNGRGQRAIIETAALLNQVWGSRDPNNPELCFDNHDGRQGTAIYRPPRRMAGGVVFPCSLVTSEGLPPQTVTIVNHNVTISASARVITEAALASTRKYMEETPKAGSHESGRNHKKRQLTFKSNRGTNVSMQKNRNKKGRFERKQLVLQNQSRGVAPSIPLHTRDLRTLLRQWVVGDPERGLPIPLADFSLAQRNGKDASGKIVKPLYSRRRVVALATLLALQDAKENGKPFAQSIGVNLIELKRPNLEQIRMSQWEVLCKKYLQRASRKLSDAEIISLGKKMYCSDVLDLLPDCGS